MSNRKEYSIGSCSEGESFDLSRSPSNSVTGNKAYYIGACSIGGAFNLSASPYNSVSNSIAYNLDNLCQYGCWNGDYRDRQYWAQIPISATSTSGADYYGALAPDIKFQGEGTYREICPTVCYCEGPVAEGVTVTRYLDRYETRWMALLEGGLIYYGRVDGALIQVPLDLFPDPLSDTATRIALSFDANARPVFAYEDNGTIYVRRYVANVPTGYSWVGAYPCLFFNGVLNPDDSMTDVVCYHLAASGGALYARFQRENFGVANLVIEDQGFDSLMAVDRGRGVLGSHMVIELSGKRIFASIYPRWPLLAQDYITASAGMLSDGDYFPVVISVSSTDALTSVAAFLTDGDYQPVTLVVSSSDAVTGTATFSTDGDYVLVVVAAPASSDSLSGTAALESDGNYYESVVPGGSYADASTATAAFLTDGDYTL